MRRTRLNPRFTASFICLPLPCSVLVCPDALLAGAEGMERIADGVVETLRYERTVIRMRPRIASTPRATSGPRVLIEGMGLASHARGEARSRAAVKITQAMQLEITEEAHRQWTR